VQSYSKESADLMDRHAEAMDCWNCEAFLQMGIDAFHWLMRADRTARMAIYRGEKEHDPAFENSLNQLCAGWLTVSHFAEQWIEKQLTLGYEIDNLEEFRDCVDEMKAIVESSKPGSSDLPLPGPIALLRDTAIDEHHNGETSEFV